MRGLVKVLAGVTTDQAFNLWVEETATGLPHRSRPSRAGRRRSADRGDIALGAGGGLRT